MLAVVEPQVRPTGQGERALLLSGRFGACDSSTVPLGLGVDHLLIVVGEHGEASCARSSQGGVRDISALEGGVVMKLLFALRNKVSAQKSLKKSAWYFWY